MLHARRACHVLYRGLLLAALHVLRNPRWASAPYNSWYMVFGPSMSEEREVEVDFLDSRTISSLNYYCTAVVTPQVSHCAMCSDARAGAWSTRVPVREGRECVVYRSLWQR